MNGVVVDLTDDTPVDLSSHGVSIRDDCVPLDLHTSNGSLEKENIEDDPYSRLDREACEKAIRSLEEELRNEETRLLLLRKIRLSQATKTKTATVSPTVRSNGHVHIPGSAQQQRHMSSGTTRPGSDGRLISTGGQSTQLPMASKSLIRSPPYSTAQRQAGIARPMVSSQLQAGGRSQRDIDILTQASGRSQRDIDLMTQQNAATLQQQKQQLMQRTAADARRQQELSAQQRQATAKQALRKQLEQTLLQIPPPKPPPPSITLVPNGNSLDFLALVGLEECVLLAERNKAAGISDDKKESESKAESEIGEKLKKNGEMSEEKVKTEQDDDDKVSTVDSKIDKKCNMKLPPLCNHCHTDFTPVWIEVKNSSDVICERCDSFNRKQALKTEHTNRLKNAFLKALQQEQAIDQGAYVAGPEARPVGSVGQSGSGAVRGTVGVSASGSSSSRAVAMSAEDLARVGRGVVGVSASHGSSGSRAVAMSAEDLARRMIAHRSSPTVTSQYRTPSNQMSRSSNGSYDRPLPSSNQNSRNMSQYDRSANQVSRQYDRATGSPATRPSPNNHVTHIDLTGGRSVQQGGSARYKMLPSDEGRYTTSRGAPYGRT